MSVDVQYIHLGSEATILRLPLLRQYSNQVLDAVWVLLFILKGKFHLYRLEQWRPTCIIGKLDRGVDIDAVLEHDLEDLEVALFDCMV